MSTGLRRRVQFRVDAGRTVAASVAVAVCLVWGVLLLLACAGACTDTVAGDTPAPIEPSVPSVQPSVEHTVVDVAVVLGGGELAPSISDGRLLSTEIMESWQQRGYIRAEQYVADGSFSGDAGFHLTLSGNQRGDTSFAMQVINALTLSLVPYSITQHDELEYVLQNVHTGAAYTATVQASDKTGVDGLLILALPFADRGHLATMQRVGDNLYEQFRRQGTFKDRIAPGRDAA